MVCHTLPGQAAENHLLSWLHLKNVFLILSLSSLTVLTFHISHLHINLFGKLSQLVQLVFEIVKNIC